MASLVSAASRATRTTPSPREDREGQFGEGRSGLPFRSGGHGLPRTGRLATARWSHEPPSAPQNSPARASHRYIGPTGYSACASNAEYQPIPTFRNITRSLVYNSESTLTVENTRTDPRGTARSSGIPQKKPIRK